MHESTQEVARAITTTAAYKLQVDPRPVKQQKCNGRDHDRSNEADGQHYRFREKLIARCRIFSGPVAIGSPEYTEMVRRRAQ